MAFALTLVLRPSGAVAATGPVAVNSVESSDIALHTPRRAATCLDHDLRGFVEALISEIVDTWCSPEASVDVSLPSTTSADGARTRALWRPQPRGPPH